MVKNKLESPTMRRLVLMATTLLAFAAAAAEKGNVNELKKLAIDKTPTGTRIVVAATKAPVFTVFRLNNPDRLVVDITGASTAGIVGHHDGAGPVTGIVASQFSDARAQVARVLVGLDKPARYDVHAEDTNLVISVDAEQAARPVAAAPEPAAEVAQAPAAAEAAPAPAGPVAKAAQAQGDDDVVASRVDEKPVKNPATHLKAIRFRRSTGLKIETDGELARFELIELKNPGRLAIDLFDVQKGRVRAPRVSDATVADVRLGAYPDKTRVVVEARSDMVAYKATRRPDGLEVRLSPRPAEPMVSSADGEAAVVEINGQTVTEIAPQTVAASKVDVTSVDFSDGDGSGRLEINLSGKARWRVERPDSKSAVLTIEGARIARKLERSLDTSELNTAVKMVSTFAVPGAQPRVRVVVAGGAALKENMVETSKGLSWRFAAKGVDSESVVASASAAGFQAEAADVAAEGAPQQRRYVGKKVSFEFKDIDIHNLLRIIADISKKNIVVADDVSGKITIRLRNVPWDQALDLILRSKGLGQERFGNNIIRVAPQSKLDDEAKARAEKRKNAIESTPLALQLVPVNYATASDMATRVKDVLSPRGTVTVDARTNTLIVRDLPEMMGKVRSMVASLDTQTPQVLIESRIVEANTRYAREVGIQWGGHMTASPGTGNPTGLVFPNSVEVTGAAGTGNSTGVSAVPNYAISLPVGAGNGNGGALGMVFGSAGGAVELNLRLSALESQGALKTISAPRVTTLDNETASISQGVSIPFSQVSAAGVNTSFVQAVLSLDVTPHITQDGSVMMKVSARNNQPDPANSGANGQPAIQRKEANTNVLVKDGDTTVIGGIYVRTGSTNQSGLPILSKIPVLGFFFRNYRELETKNELLIFITPRILNRAAVAQNL